MKPLELAPLSQAQLDELETLYRSTKEMRLRTRAQIILLAAEQKMSAPTLPEGNIEDTAMTCGTEPHALLLQRLNRHPQLRACVKRLLGVVGDATGEIRQADAAERRVIEELRQLSQEALTAWAERSLDKSAAEAPRHQESEAVDKKLY